MSASSTSRSGPEKLSRRDLLLLHNARLIVSLGVRNGMTENEARIRLTQLAMRASHARDMRKAHNGKA